MYLTEEEYEHYKKTIDDMREQMYENTPKEMANNRVENKSYPKTELRPDFASENAPEGLRVFGEVELNTRDERFIAMANAHIKRAYCPYCGEEIVTKNPVMCNPFNFEPKCIYECQKCGTTYGVDGSYPRLTISDPKNNEVKLHLN